MSISPIGDIVLVKQEEFGKSKTSLVIPDTVKLTKEVTGVVYAVGTDIKGVESGDKVILLPLQYLIIQHEGFSYMVARQKEVIGKLS